MTTHDKSGMPAEIYAYKSSNIAGYYTTTLHGIYIDTTQYLRADLAQARIAELEEALRLMLESHDRTCAGHKPPLIIAHEEDVAEAYGMDCTRYILPAPKEDVERALEDMPDKDKTDDTGMWLKDNYETIRRVLLANAGRKE